MYYYHWPYQYYYQCSLGCTDPSQCQYQNQYFPTNFEQQYVNSGYQYVDQYTSQLQNNNEQNNDTSNGQDQANYQNNHQFQFNQEYAHKVIQALENLQQKIEDVEKENEELKEKVENIKPINIEAINYKIQELTVEELSGTLNIGLSALTDAENLKKLLEEKGEIKFNDIDTEAMENLEEMDDFNANINNNNNNNNAQ